MIRSVRTITSVVCAAWVAAACGSSGNPPRIVLHFWAMGREAEVVSELLPDFEKLHPQVRVAVEHLPWTAAHEKLLTAVAGDSTPDLCQLGNTWIAELAALKALAPLDDGLSRSSSIDRSDYFQGAWEANVIGNATYGVPWYVDTRVLFYRTDILAAGGFAAPPRTWSEWRAMLAAITEQAHGERFGVLLPLDEYGPLIALSLQQHAALLRDHDSRGNFANPEFERTLQFYADMFRLHYAPPFSNSQISNLFSEFGRGYFAFYISGPWNIGEFKRRLPPELQDKWMTAPLPGPDGPGASSAGGSSLAVFRRSKHAAAAWALIEFLSRPQVQQRFHALTGDLPPRRSVWDSPSIAADVYTRAFREQLERAKPVPRVPEWERIAIAMQLVAERVVRGELGVPAGARELDADTDRILGKRRELLAEGLLAARLSP